MSIRIIAIFPKGSQSFHVQWEVASSVAGAGPFNFQLLRSGSPGGPFDVVLDNLGDTYTAEDTLPLVQGMNKDVYYQVAAIGRSFLSAPTHSASGMLPRQALARRKIINDNDVLLRKGSGVPVQIFKRRHWGVRCPVCYDKATGRVTLKNCATCFGVSFVGGYFTPIDSRAIIKPSAIGTDYTSDTSIPEISTASSMLPVSPAVKKGDILVETAINVRWEVVQGQDTEILRNTVHQDITISRLPTDHVVYKLGTP